MWKELVWAGVVMLTQKNIKEAQASWLSEGAMLIGVDVRQYKLLSEEHGPITKLVLQTRIVVAEDLMCTICSSLGFLQAWLFSGPSV